MFVFLFWFMVKESNEFIKTINNAIYIRIIAVHDKSYKVYCIFSDNGRYFQHIHRYKYQTHKLHFPKYSG